jgi:hypothetical protein
MYVKKYHEDEPSLTVPEKIDATKRIILVLIGLAVFCIGLYLALKMFLFIHDAVMHPKTAKEQLIEWVDFISEGVSKEDIEKMKVPPALIAMAGFGLFSLILTWISISIMMAGAKIISWTKDEKKEIKRMLREMFRKGRDYRALHKTVEEDKEEESAMGH